METYRVAELARLAGVTVRTLHHYDAIALLKPSQVTEAGHRLYTVQDLLTLQQILTLKWMGFDLVAVKNILHSPAYNLHESLTIQKAAVMAQIARLEQAVLDLEQAIQMTKEMGGEQLLGAETIQAIIFCLTHQEQAEWLQRYYTPAAWAGIQTRALAYTPADFERFAAQWSAIFADFENCLQQGESPTSSTAQAIVPRMNDLIQLFTAGDPATLAGLRRFGEDAEAGNLPPNYQGHTPYENVPDDLRHFIQSAYTYYQERTAKK